MLLTFLAIPEREEVVALQGVQDGTLMELFSEGWIYQLSNYTGICLSELPRNDAHSEKENQEIETERFKASHQLKQSPTKTCLKEPEFPFGIFGIQNFHGEACDFVWRPFKYQTMHFHSICEGGETWSGSLMEMVFQPTEAGTPKLKMWNFH